MSVPVLSVQITLVQLLRDEGVGEKDKGLGLCVTSFRNNEVENIKAYPNVSTDGSLRTITFLLAILLVPKLRHKVITAGRPSGIAATPRATATCQIWIQSIKMEKVSVFSCTRSRRPSLG